MLYSIRGRKHQFVLSQVSPRRVTSLAPQPTNSTMFRVKMRMIKMIQIDRANFHSSETSSRSHLSMNLSVEKNLISDSINSKYYN